METLNWIIQNMDSLWIIGTSIVTVASIIIRLTPTQKDDTILKKILDIVHTLSIPKK